MTAKVFVDSNVLIYAHNADAGEKRDAAAALLRDLWAERRGCLSSQVLQEFYVNVTRKIRRPLTRAAAREVVRNYASWVEQAITPSTIVRASEIEELAQLSFWDGLIVAAAEAHRAREIASEDLQHGQVIAGMRVRNPFARDERPGVK